MTRRRKILALLALGVVLLAGTAFAAWWFLIRSDAPDPVSVGEAVASATSSPTTGATSPQGIEGTWSAAAGSFAGYRVQEELAGIGVTTAAGRTEGVTGTMVIEGGRG